MFKPRIQLILFTYKLIVKRQSEKKPPPNQMINCVHDCDDQIVKFNGE